MNTATDNNIGDTIRIRRPARVTTSERGHTVWMGDVEPSWLELADEYSNDPYNSVIIMRPWLPAPQKRSPSP